MQSPPSGSTFTSSTVTFNWSAGSASTYWLYVGSSFDGADIYNSGPLSAQSVTVTIPTDGRTIYVRLWSLIGGSWENNFIDYTYRARN